MNIWTYFRGHEDQTLQWTWATIWMAGIPLFVGLLLALPVGWLASRFRWSYPPVTAAVGLLYTIPSLVLFVVLPSIIGTRILDTVNVVVALTVYSFALLVRVIADGLNSVSADTLAAAAAMGHTGPQRLFRVQLPIAVPVIGAGLRVAAVSNVSLVSVAALIGIPQLGQLFIIGNTFNSVTPILLGLILFVLLALIFDLTIQLVVRLLTPWQRAAAEQ